MKVYSVAQELNGQAQELIEDAVAQYHEKYGFGSMSTAVYDTAWVAMITKTIDDPDGGKTKIWLFPESFQYLVNTQSEDGSWDGVGCASPVDSILNTAASLLALKRHLADPLQMVIQDDNDFRFPRKNDNLESRVGRAAKALQARLKDWDVSGSNSVGFEIIIPAVLEMLEGEGLVFDFEGKRDLLAIRGLKLARFKPEYLYGKQRLTAVHSLEAFVGRIDFDKVAHHCTRGAMMGSPSSTAAYLMYASHWNDDAEAYLRHVVGGERGGGAPSAYPSTYFEYTWILSTLLRAGFSTADLACPALDRMRNILEKAFKEEGGTIGFAPEVGEDVDDTAKGIMSLAMLLPGEHESLADPMIQHFEAESHFRTYASERDPSFSANCNALLALLHQQDPARYEAQILKIARFLCGYWWDTHGTPCDKWNLSSLYSCMLVAQAFTDLLALADQSLLRETDHDLLSRISITLVQCCIRVMLKQSHNGSWEDSIEQTSYGVAVLSEALRLSCFQDLHDQLTKMVDAAVHFLINAPPASDYIWIEKVTYSSPFLTQSYKLAALKLGMRPGDHTVGLPVKVSPKYIGLFRPMPLFSGVPEWQLHASNIESALFSPMCRTLRLKIFSRKDMEEDEYFDMIPFIWTACNNYSQAFASANFLYELMIVSFLNFQADEFMEVVAGHHFKDNISGLRRLIDEICLDDAHSVPLCFSPRPTVTTVDVHVPEDVSGPLAGFVSRLFQHPAVTRAGVWDQKRLREELRVYLQAHVTQTEDNARLEQYDADAAATATADTFSRWVRTTSADHTSCPYAFAFVSCWLSSSSTYGGGRGDECFPTASQKYFAESWCRHLAIMCRMYNDIGSIARDAAEANLNSVDFPEFACAKPVPVTNGNGAAHQNGVKQPTANGIVKDLNEKKEELFKIAEYERACLNEAQLWLEGEMLRKGPMQEANKAKLAIWRVFRDVTDLHGQIYVVRDIASRIKPISNGHTGTGLNGTDLNGTGLNSAGLNGAGLNEIGPNGAGLNGTSLNGSIDH